MPSNVVVFEKTIVIPTYSMVSRSTLPPIFDPEVVYPYNGFLLTATEPRDKTYKALVLENDVLRVTVLPELGGRILQIEDVKKGTKYLHENDVVLPTRISMRWAFISLGIELNFPVAHSPTGISEIGYKFIECPNGGKGIAVGEKEIMWGLNWRAEIKLFPNSKAVCLSAKCWNPTKTARDVQWWSNAAQPVGEETEFVFPYESVIEHSEEAKTGQWPIVDGIDRRWHKNYDNMCGLFWQETKSDWFGIYHHDIGMGLLHLSDPHEMPGKKMWTFGQTGSTADWTLAMTRNGGISCEIQSGIPATQSGFINLKPNEELSFIEFWVPVDSRKEFHDSNRLSFEEVVNTLGGKEVLYVEKKEIESSSMKFWKNLIQAFEEGDKNWIMEQQSCLDDIWPPTGLDLENALKWASSVVGGLWNYSTALYLYADKKFSEAMSFFEISPKSLNVEALMAMIEWKGFNNPEAAWNRLKKVIREIPDGALLVAANSILRELNNIEDRKAIFNYWPDWDYRKRETEAEVAIDEGNPEQALHILTYKPWERHHGCRYRRTELWRKAMAMLGRNSSDVPTILGEDPFKVNEDHFGLKD